MAGTLTTTATQTLQTTKSLQQQIGTQLQNSISNQQFNLGNFVTNVSILPYIKSVTLKFSAHGLKPNTRLYAYFGNVPVSAWCAPVPADYDNSTVASQQTSPQLGTPLFSDSTGTCIGVFRIPANTFKSSEIEFKLTDIADLIQGADAVTTEADGTYYGSTLSVASGQSLLNTRQTVLSSSEVTQQQTVDGLAVASDITQTYVEDPPPVYYGGDSCGCKIICTKLYQLGMMDEETFKADQEFGELLRTNDPEVYNGYVAWAQKVVDWMSGDTPDVMFWIRDPEKRRARELELTLMITYRIATPWAEHMQFLMGKREHDNRVGRWIMAVGRPVSRLVGKFGKTPSKYSMLAIFFTLYGVSKLFGEKTGFPKPIKEI